MVYVESDDPDQYTIGLVRVMVILGVLASVGVLIWALLQGNLLLFLLAKPTFLLLLVATVVGFVMAVSSISGMGRRTLVIRDVGDQLTLAAANDLERLMPLIQAMPKTVVSRAEIYPYSYRGWSGSVDVKQPSEPINAVWLRLGDPELPRWVLLEHTEAVVDLESIAKKWNARLHAESIQKEESAAHPPKKVILDQRKRLL